MKPIVIVGTGLAGYTLARELRRLDTVTPVVLITRDDGRFYSKPLLSTALAQGKTADALAMASAGHMERQFDIQVRTRTPVLGLDPRTGRIQTEDGGLDYFKLILAVGADPVRLPLAGDAVTHVVSVSDLSSYRRFRDYLAGRKRVAIMGAGLIGCELANDLRGAGFQVDIIDPAGWPLARLVPEPVGRALRRALAALGVGWHLSTRVRRVDRHARHYRLALENDYVLEADLVLSAAGLQPRMQLAKAAGIACMRGIRVDRYLQTNREAVYAIGDCAEVEGLVMPYVASIMHCARALARTLAGRYDPVRYPAMPVVVKTPAHPVVVSPPPPALRGQWQCEAAGDGVRALYRDAQGRLLGFALSGAAVKEQQALLRDLPGVLG